MIQRTVKYLDILIACSLLLLRRPAEAWRSSTQRPRSVAARRPSAILVHQAVNNHHHQQDRNDQDHDTDTTITSHFVATCVPGLSSILADELQDLGCTQVTPTGGAAVEFTATGRTALQTLLWARTPHKIMESLVVSPPNLHTRDDLHNFIYDQVNVQQLLGNGQGGLLTLAVSTTLVGASLPKDLRHSHYTALTIKNALCDAVRDLRGDRPDVNRDNPDVPLVAVVRGSSNTGAAQVSLYRQIHGPVSLHKRGYRPATVHKAALKESLAAGLLLQAGWADQCRAARNQQQPQQSVPRLLDPMAGSGTLVVEALLMAADVAPHLLRIKTSRENDTEDAVVHQLPPILRWKDYAPLRTTVWPDLLQTATLRAQAGLAWLHSSQTTRVHVNDIHTGALRLLDASLHRAGLDGLVDIQAGDATDWHPVRQNEKDNDPWTVVCNPPWGIRLEEDIEASWEALRHFLRETCPPGTVAYILSGNPSATKRLGLRRSQSFPVKVGTHDLRWLKYKIHGGSVHDGSTEAKFTAEKTRPPVANGSNNQRGQRDDGDRTRSKPKNKTRSAAPTTNEWLI